ncbi:MAG: hypothetical protein HKO66_04410 [Saprospiraceae bacterium]|nr:hypothetical protein [Bacteroidia bacterium]NNE15058.1 hypothetical protein [Saprospiraceae bacterium]NNL91452.1 hypothetical protein [Saprospiraceae bacterium]
MDFIKTICRYFNFFKTLGLLGFIYVLLEFLLFVCHENAPEDVWLESISNKTELIYQPEIKRNLIGLKFESLKLIRPDIIVIGNSRVNNYRSQMFEPYSFYNLSLSFVSFDKTKQLMNILPEDSRPKVIFMLIEPLVFRKGFDALKSDIKNKLYVKQRTTLPVVNFGFQLDTFKIKNLIAENKFIGLKAKRAKRGFRSSDGSNYIGFHYNKSHLFQEKRHKMQKQTIRQIPKRGIFKDFDQPLNENSYLEFSNLVEFLDSMNIKLVAFQLPFNQTVQDLFDSDKEKFKLWHEFQSDEHLQRMKDINHGRYYNFSRLADYGGKNTEMMDLIHPSEKIIGKTISTLCQDKSFREILPLINKQKIDSLLQTSSFPIKDVFTDHKL